MGLSREEMLELRKKKLVKQEFKDRPMYQILMAIPKHLLKVSIITIIGSFIVMFYKINNKQSLNEFISKSDDAWDLKYYTVHPILQHMQRLMLLDDP